MLRRARAIGASLAALAILGWGCDHTPECSSAELRYSGRPPERLFSFNGSCRDDCFSAPRSAAQCDRSCPDVRVIQPLGYLQDDRSLVIVDQLSLQGGRGLVHRFGFVDESAGAVPFNWTFVSEGQRTYVADELQGTTRFIMDVTVADDAVACADGTGVCDGEEIAVATPGRLEVTAVDESHIVGRYFLAFESTTGQPQAEVVGCFNVSMGALQAGALGTTRRLLSPQP